MDLSAIELMLICWPWQRLGEGLKELGPMEDVIFSSLVSIALNHGNEWYHARTINDNNPIHEYVVKPFALWCEQYKNSSNVGVPRLGWWEVLSQRWKDGFTEQLAPSIIENLIHTLPTLSPKDLGDLLFVVVEQHNNLGGVWIWHVPDNIVARTHCRSRTTLRAGCGDNLFSGHPLPNPARNARVAQRAGVGRPRPSHSACG